MENNFEYILWFLCGKRDVASSRLHGYLIHEKFKELGVDSHIIFTPDERYVNDIQYIENIPVNINLKKSVSIVQKLYGPNTDKLISWLKSRGSFIVYVNCDLKQNNISWRKSDLVMAISDRLCQYHKQNDVCPVTQISEPYEYSSFPRRRKYKNGNEAIHAIWFGSKGNFNVLKPWKKILEKEFGNLIDLITCSDHPEATYQWSIRTQSRLLYKSDIVILPTEQTMPYSCKSSNKLIQAMAMGKPCIVGPLHSYMEIKRMEPSVLVANNDEEFRRHLVSLLDDEFRFITGMKSYYAVIEKYSKECIAKQWLDTLNLNTDISDDIKKMNNKTVYSLKRYLKLFKIIGRYSVLIKSIKQGKKILNNLRTI